MIKNLVKWSHDNFSKLPWRVNRSLYTTLVSEIMLQQTTVGTVLGHFDRFIKEYPDFLDVANATEDQLTISWKGLGYYRRARNLKKACIQIAQLGSMPNTLEDLIKIPGIGEYTAGAILGIGKDRPFLAIDGNLERVIARMYGLTEVAGPKLKKQIMELFNQGKICQEIYQVGGRNFNEALMDLGRNFCKSQNASCALCPMQSNCKAFKSGRVKLLPIKDEKKSVSHKLTLLRLIIQNEDKVFGYQKKKNEWLQGQWEIPTFIIETDDPKLSQYPRVDYRVEFDLLPAFKSLITKYKIENRVLALTFDEVRQLGIQLPEGSWHKLEKGKHNFSTATIKAMEI